MKKKNFALTAIIVSGFLGLGQAWSQETPESGQPRVPGNVEQGLGDLGTSGMEGHRQDMRSSEDIRKAQEALKEHGHDPGSTSGVMDEQTRAAISAFQQENDLPVTGTLDNDTAEKLGISESESTEPQVPGADTGQPVPGPDTGSISPGDFGSSEGKRGY